MTLKKVRKYLYVVSIVTAILACYLSFNTEYGKVVTGYDLETSAPVIKEYPIDSGTDGGAAGFAILSGLSLVSASITFLKED